MSGIDGGGVHAEDGILTGLLTNLRFDPRDPDSYFNWHETRGVSRAALEALYRDPKSNVSDLERLYRKAGINIRDLKDLLDESADPVTLRAVFAKNKKAYVKGPAKSLLWPAIKWLFAIAVVVAAVYFVALPFLSPR